MPNCTRQSRLHISLPAVICARYYVGSGPAQPDGRAAHLPGCAAEPAGGLFSAPSAPLTSGIVSRCRILSAEHTCRSFSGSPGRRSGLRRRPPPPVPPPHHYRFLINLPQRRPPGFFIGVIIRSGAGWRRMASAPRGKADRHWTRAAVMATAVIQTGAPVRTALRGPPAVSSKDGQFQSVYGALIAALNKQ